MMARRLLRTLPALSLLVLSGLLAACNTGSGTDPQNAAEGQPVQLGDLQTTVEFSRILNPNDAEDTTYLVGQPPPPPNRFYFGIFVQIINKSKSASATIPTNWQITDTEHQTFRPLPTSSPDALALGKPIGPEDQAPPLDSDPQSGPIQAALILFSIPDTAPENRPFQLLIPGQGGPGVVNLDF